MLKIAKIIRPDKLIFSALDLIQYKTQPNIILKENIPKLVKELKPLGIDVKINWFHNDPIHKRDAYFYNDFYY